jgi:Flp pilus assembly protein TadG
VTGPDESFVHERGGGAVNAPMAIALLALFIVIALAIDGVRAAQGLARADAIAEEAARAAGQALDSTALSRGDAAVDPVAAVAAAQDYLTAAGATGTATVRAPDLVRVEVTITRPTILLGLIGQDQLISRGSAEAVLVPTVPGAGP